MRVYVPGASGRTSEYDGRILIWYFEHARDTQRNYRPVINAKLWTVWTWAVKCEQNTERTELINTIALCV